MHYLFTDVYSCDIQASFFKQFLYRFKLSNVNICCLVTGGGLCSSVYICGCLPLTHTKKHHRRQVSASLLLIDRIFGCGPQVPNINTHPCHWLVGRRAFIHASFCHLIFLTGIQCTHIQKGHMFTKKKLQAEGLFGRTICSSIHIKFPRVTVVCLTVIRPHSSFIYFKCVVLLASSQLFQFRNIFSVFLSGWDQMIGLRFGFSTNLYAIGHNF